jgi:hypothetical protein
MTGYAVSFLGIHKSEPDIYIGFSLALHLQCGVNLRYQRNINNIEQSFYLSLIFCFPCWVNYSLAGLWEEWAAHLFVSDEPGKVKKTIKTKQSFPLYGCMVALFISLALPLNHSTPPHPPRCYWTIWPTIQAGSITAQHLPGHHDNDVTRVMRLLPTHALMALFTI